METKQNYSKLCAWLARPALSLWLAGSAVYLGSLGSSHAQKVFSENFDSLSLGRNVEEALAGSKVWTKTPPAGWVADDSKVPGVGDPKLNGVTEWAGWSFANKDWWVRTAGDQRRSEFVLGRGTVMIADPDEWDDATHTSGLYETTITTSGIGLTNQPANSLVLVFDSSWRPEAVDDGSPNFPVAEDGSKINDQIGFITAAFDGGTAADVLRWDSISDNPNFHDHFPNESVVVPLNNPAGAKTLSLKFGMEKAANDWWWAVDNIAVGVPPFMTGVAADGVSATVRIVEALGKTVDQARGLTVELDGQAVTPVNISTEGDYLRIAYSQAPEVFQPNSLHTIKVKYTPAGGAAREESETFVAPGYTEVTATPMSVTATMTDTDWLTVDEAKGVKLELDGASIAAVTPSRTDNKVAVRFSTAQAFAANSTHSLKVTFTTATGKQIVDTVAFTAPDYKTLPASLATAAGTGSQPGLRWRTHQLEAARGTTIAEAEQQLAGKSGASVHDQSGQGADGYFPIDVVNFEQSTGEAGSFKSSAAAPQNVDDQAFPGIPGTSGGLDYFAGEALTYIAIPQAGIYTMVVNSDDGFQVSAGTTNNPTQVVLGAFDGGRGAADSEFYFKADQAGVYLFRMLYFEGSGGASAEWLTVNSDGSRALVNGTQAGALKSFRLRTVAEPVAAGAIQSFSMTGGKLTIHYTGTLKSSTSVTGPYLPVAGATSPYAVTPAGSQSFFLVQ